MDWLSGGLMVTENTDGLVDDAGIDGDRLVIGLADDRTG